MHDALAGAGLLSDGSATAMYVEGEEKGRRENSPASAGSPLAKLVHMVGGEDQPGVHPGSQHQQLDKLTSTPLTEGRGPVREARTRDDDGRRVCAVYVER